MPRKTRIYLPNVPVHLVQRGHNRDACFFADEDFQFYKEVLAEGLFRYGAQLHAYCLMTNHVHLLLTPFAADSLPRILQHLGRMYVHYINNTYRRRGTLWEGRYKASLVDAEKYLLACYRYIELNPVTAAMVEKPEEYRWSSYHANAMGFADPLVSPHDVYSRVAGDDALRRFYYRELFQVSLSEHDVHCIRSCLTANQVLGEGKFKDQIGAALKRKLGHVQQPALLGNSRRPLDASPIPPTIARAISSQSPP